MLVHAIPASDVQEYQGMPMFSEVGPLTMDPAVQQEVDLLDKEPPVVFDKVTIKALQHADL